MRLATSKAIRRSRKAVAHIRGDHLMIGKLGLVFWGFVFSFSCLNGWAETKLDKPIEFTIIHTNDLHSHFRPDKGPFGLGGIARIATTIKKIRKETPYSILVDGGDWSEGSIYYNLDAGRTSIEMLDKLGYNAVVLGNHDWLNGPEQLLHLLDLVKPKFKLVSANLEIEEPDPSLPHTAQELSSISASRLLLKNYFHHDNTAESYSDRFGAQIFEIGPEGQPKVKVGVIGLTTYSLIYDKYGRPLSITEPYFIARKIAAELKPKVDLVIVISHNNLDGFPASNRLIAGLPNVDIVIHAHDHLKLQKPIVVNPHKNNANQKTSYIVETGAFGHYVGRMDLLIDQKTKKWRLKDYKLIQQDSNIADDPQILELVNKYDKELEEQYGKIFDDHIADTKIDITKESDESSIGNLVADAYREFTQADVAFEHVTLTSGELYTGPIQSVDVYNALTPIFTMYKNGASWKKSWTLKTMRMTAQTLDWLMNLIVQVGGALPKGLPSISGMKVVYDAPSVPNKLAVFDSTRRPLKELWINGKLNSPTEDQSYLIALSEGIRDTFEFLEDQLGNQIDRSDFKDTGIEDWRVVSEYLKKHSPIVSSTIPRGRFQTLQPDLAIYRDDIQVLRKDCHLEIQAFVRNLGTLASEQRTLTVSYDSTPKDTTDDPNLSPPKATVPVGPVPGVGSGANVEIVSLAFDLPIDLCAIPLPLYFKLSDSAQDPNKGNDGTWLLLR